MNQGIDLLIESLRRAEKEAKLNHLQYFSAAVWEEAFKYSARNGLAPLFYHTLKPFLKSLPEAINVREKLRRAYFFSAARNVRLYHQLLNLVILFEKEEIPVILLKGSHLAELVYGNLALRPMLDMDLLIRPSDLEKADRLLRLRGYSTSNPLQGTIFKHLEPYIKKGSITIEVHYQIADPPFSKRYAIEDLWERSRREKIEGVEVLTLSPEDLLLHLCIHAGIDHGFEFGILPCIDVAHTVEHYRAEIDWQILFQRAETWGMQRALYLVLALTEKMFGISLPDFITSAMKSNPEAEEALASAEEIVFSRKHGASKFIARLFGPEKLRFKFLLIIKSLLQAKEHILISMPAKQGTKTSYFLRARAYLLWINQMYSKYGRTFWRALHGDPKTVELINNENRRNLLRRWLGQK